MSNQFKPMVAGGVPQPGCCKWCGEPLKYEVSKKVVPMHTPFGVVQTIKTTRADRPGRYQDGHFCGLHCGYQAAVYMLNTGSQNG